MSGVSPTRSPAAPTLHTLEQQQPQTPLTPSQYFLVNLAAKATAVFSFHPFVTIKNRIQAEATEKAQKITNQSQQKLSPKAVSLTFGMKETIANIFKIVFVKNNPFKLYRGISVNLLNAPIFATMGAINGTLKNYLSDGGKRELTQLQKGCIALFASFVGSYPWTVLDFMVLQTQLQNKHIEPHRTDVWGFVKKVVKLDWKGFEELLKKDRESRLKIKSQKKAPHTIFKEVISLRGIKGLFRGLLPTKGREIPFGWGLLYMGPEADRFFKLWLPENQKHLSPVLSGISVGSLLALITHPNDMIKTTIQKDWKAVLYPGMLDAAKGIYGHGGYTAFFKGLLPRLGIICIATTVVVDRTRAYTQMIQDKK